MKDFIGVYDNAFTPDQCNELIEYIESLQQNHLLFQDEDKKHNTDHQAVGLFYHNLLGTSPFGVKFLPNVQKYIDDYLNEYSVLSRQRFLIYDVKVKKIPNGGGFHAWHYEANNFVYASRAFVVQLYLNDIEEGGETEFLYISKRIKARAGRVIIFPAGFTHTHRGNPPLGQTKYICSSWGIVQE